MRRVVVLAPAFALIKDVLLVIAFQKFLLGHICLCILLKDKLRQSKQIQALVSTIFNTPGTCYYVTLDLLLYGDMAFVDSLQHRELEPIQYFYHMTTTPNIRKIFEDGMMIPRKTDSPYWTKLARDQNSPIGVWFSGSLYHGEHPVTSPYGENRIKIPCQFIVQNMFKPRLFLESFYYFESTPKNQIVRLILVDAQVYRKEHDWCDKHCLQRVNMVDNKILILDRNTKTYKSVKNDGIMFPYVWVEILVVGHVEMVAIDSIEETAPSKQDAIPGKVPPLK